MMSETTGFVDDNHMYLAMDAKLEFIILLDCWGGETSAYQAIQLAHFLMMSSQQAPCPLQ